MAGGGIRAQRASVEIRSRSIRFRGNPCPDPRVHRKAVTYCRAAIERGRYINPCARVQVCTEICRCGTGRASAGTEENTPRRRSFTVNVGRRTRVGTHAHTPARAFLLWSSSGGGWEGRWRRAYSGPAWTFSQSGSSTRSSCHLDETFGSRKKNETVGTRRCVHERRIHRNCYEQINMIYVKRKKIVLIKKIYNRIWCRSIIFL